MQYYFYIGAYGDEKAIHTLHTGLSYPGSAIRELRVPLGDGSMLWTWHTPYQPCSTELPVDKLSEFVVNSPELISKLKDHRARLNSMAGVVVCEYEEGEDPRGFSIPEVLISVLSDIDAGLEIDVVPIVPDSSNRRRGS